MITVTDEMVEAAEEAGDNMCASIGIPCPPTRVYSAALEAALRAAPAAEPVADGWRPDAEKMREDCARWCETNGFAEAAPMLRKLPISRSRTAPTEAEQ